MTKLCKIRLSYITIMYRFAACRALILPATPHPIFDSLTHSRSRIFLLLSITPCIFHFCRLLHLRFFPIAHFREVQCGSRTEDYASLLWLKVLRFLTKLLHHVGIANAGFEPCVTLAGNLQITMDCQRTSKPYNFQPHSKSLFHPR
jgi:hypothetical protein